MWCGSLVDEGRYWGGGQKAPLGKGAESYGELWCGGVNCLMR